MALLLLRVEAQLPLHRFLGLLPPALALLLRLQTLVRLLLRLLQCRRTTGGSGASNGRMTPLALRSTAPTAAPCCGRGRRAACMGLSGRYLCRRCCRAVMRTLLPRVLPLMLLLLLAPTLLRPLHQKQELLLWMRTTTAIFSLALAAMMSRPPLQVLLLQLLGLLLLLQVLAHGSATMQLASEVYHQHAFAAGDA